MTFHDVVRALRRFWPLSVAVAGLLVVIGIAAAFLPAERYRASTLLFVQPSDARSLEFGARESLDLLMPTIVQQVGTRRFAEAVKASGTDLGDVALGAVSEPGTGVLTITAESTSPTLAAAAADAAASQLERDRLSTAIRFSVLDPAVPPESPSSPKKAQIMLGSIVLGLILAVFAALAANAVRRRVDGAEMIRRSFGLTVLGEITRSRRLRQRPAMLFRDPEAAEVVEEYHHLRTNFDLLSHDVRTVAVTSWTQGEGKTTVVANLGWMLASLGRDVTIVDLDLRRPAVHVPFDLDLRGGVADLVRPGRPARLTVRPKHTGLTGLDVLTAGVLDGDPAKTIEGAFPKISEMLDDRLVLIDTPPLLASETALIASLVDALVIVIDVRRRDPAELEAVMQVLKLTQTTVLGVVLNRVRSSGRLRQVSDYYGAGRDPGPVRSVLGRLR